MIFNSSASAQYNYLNKKDLFTIATSTLIKGGAFTYRIAVNSEEIIAVNSCNQPRITFLDSTGKIIDSILLDYRGCLRNMEFDEYDNLLMMDNEEKNIFKWNHQTKKVETIPYNKPEDWYKQINHYYRAFELSSIPTYYVNPDYPQDFYYSRFPYSYNLWLNYNNGFIYQCAYNFLKKIGNHTTYVKLNKGDIWFSERLSNKCKLLMIDLEKETAVYYDRSLNLIYEDFKNDIVDVNYCAQGVREAVQLDFATNMQQKKIWGVCRFDWNTITFSCWTIGKNE